MANAAIALYEATSDKSYLNDAVGFLATLDHWYLDEDGAGHYLTAVDSGDIPIRIRGDADEAITSATGQIIEAFARTVTATNRLDLLDRAWAVAKAATGRITKQSYGQAGIVSACTILEGSRKLVIVEDEAVDTLRAAARRHPDPRRIDIVLPRGAQPVELPGGAVLDTSRSAAWLCVGQSCLPPLDDEAKLVSQLMPQSTSG